MGRFTLITVAAFALVACGGSDDATSATPAATAAPVITEPPATTTPATTTPATTTPATTAPAATASPVITEAPAATEAPAETEAPADTVAPPDAGVPNVVDVSLAEWAVAAPTELAAGGITFEVSNDGNFPHRLEIARGNSYEELPQLGNGAVDEAALGDEFIGGTDNIAAGGTTTIDFDLPPGNYVLFCNIVSGPTSHAARGQVLSVTVG